MASPPLAAAAAGSGSEASSASEEAATTPPADRDLAALFEQAAQRLPALLPAASKEQLLYLYARYKQVKFGTCNTPKPGFFDFEGKQKWEAWKALGDVSPHQAMQEYVATVKKLDPSWNPQMTEKKVKENKTAFGGPVVSSLYQEETIREEDKNIFDYCRENNIDYVTKAIRSRKVDVNVTDEEGRALLHWACDRGHKELVSVLLQHDAEVNSQGNLQPCVQKCLLPSLFNPPFNKQIKPINHRPSQKKEPQLTGKTHWRMSSSAEFLGILNLPRGSLISA
ncbi:acyl-CoA-binding domain-containing protein 6 isoform X1 [Pogoniulus pusillus]|uniref:acyl-CoA-binding domain-containing protein 6 isoform X1 n=1 Tax=Pogoniulus pusillus TaxID=488313 RepID=UPI0030B94AD2